MALLVRLKLFVGVQSFLGQFNFNSFFEVLSELFLYRQLLLPLDNYLLNMTLKYRMLLLFNCYVSCKNKNQFHILIDEIVSGPL